MNRMIRLFQNRSDLAYERYLKNRNEAVGRFTLNSPEWSAAVMRGAGLLAESQTWSKAAELLRKEELNALQPPAKDAGQREAQP
jgi:hypothetical protein